MAEIVLIDAGPLAALLDRQDQHHAWVLEQFKLLHDDLLTCEADVSEAFYLVRHNHSGTAALRDLLDSGVVRLKVAAGVQMAQVTALMRKYHDIPMSFADACLVHLSERHEDSRIFTTDSDFKLYRRHGRQSIPLIFPR